MLRGKGLDGRREAERCQGLRSGSLANRTVSKTVWAALEAGDEARSTLGFQRRGAWWAKGCGTTPCGLRAREYASLFRNLRCLCFCRA